MMKIDIMKSKKKCYICRKAFGDNKKQKKRFKLYKKVRDHSHFTGKFKGAAHSICNTKHPKKFLQKFIMVQNMITT